jgi:hypothetical protein
VSLIVESKGPFIRELLKREPWRAGQGVGDHLCDHQIEWDGGSHWTCTTCGRVSCSVILDHKPVQRPVSMLENFLKEFVDGFREGLGAR